MKSNEQPVGLMQRYIGAAIILFLLACAWLLYGGLASRHTLHFFQGKTMGTYYKVSYVEPSATEPSATEPSATEKTSATDLQPLLVPQPEQLQNEVEELLVEFNQQLSTYDPRSVISLLNEHRSAQPFVVPSYLLRALSLAYDLYQLSEGALDPTLAPLIRLWGFASEQRTAEGRPDDSAIAAALQKVGLSKWSVEEHSSSVRKGMAESEINLSAVAKGYGVDVLAELLELRGVRDYLIDIGGEVRAAGLNQRRHPWQVGVVDPRDLGQIVRLLPLQDGSLATSGSYSNFFEEDGVRYSHIIDPRDGLPVKHATVSVSVMHEDCAVADGWATALLVLGSKRGLAMAEKQGLAVLFMDAVSEQSEELQMLTSERWRGWDAGSEQQSAEKTEKAAGG